MDTPILLTVREAADHLRIKRSLAYELVAQGTIPSLRLGPRCIRVPYQALVRWADEQTQATTKTG